MSGQVVGVVTFGLKQGQDLNFAMPWFTLARLLSQDDPLGYSKSDSISRYVQEKITSNFQRYDSGESG